MTADEKIKFESMESSVTQIERDVTEIKMALLGNPLSGEKGLTGRIDVLDAKQEILEKRIETLTEEKVENRVYVLIIKVLLTLLAGSVITYLFTHFK